MSLEEVSSRPLAKLAPRAVASHKGDYGRVLIIGGSRGMAGAPALAGRAALRSGAGLVTLAVPRSIQSTVAGYEPSYMTLGLGEPSEDFLLAECKAEILAAAANMEVLALGPGLGSDLSTAQLVCDLYQEVRQPMIVDADGLNALAKAPQAIPYSGGPRILTPHPGEFQRLLGEPCGNEITERARHAKILCRSDNNARTIVVLKGHQTIVSDCVQYSVNQTGNPGMATGGTGDWLVAQGLSPWEAARLGAHVHGLAGDLAAEELGQTSLIASDLIDFLPAAFEKIAGG